MVALLGGSGRPPSDADRDDLGQFASPPVANQLGTSMFAGSVGIW